MKSLTINPNNINDEDDEESSFSKSRFTIFLLIVLEISFFIKGYLNCSPIITANSAFFPFVKTYHQDMAQIDFTVENLTSLNRFLQIDLIFYRYKAGTNVLMHGEYNYTVEFFSDNESVAYLPNQYDQFDFFSYQSYLNFLPQTIFYQPIVGYDKISANLTILANLTDLKGLSIDYFFVNSNFCQLYNNLSIVFVICSSLTLLRFLIFCYSKRQSNLMTNDKFLLILNILTFLSSINYQYFHSGVQLFMLTLLITDILIIIFRVYTIYLLDSLINRSTSISESLYTEIFHYFFFFLALVYHDYYQFEAKIYARLVERPGFSIPMNKLFILFFHIWYIITIILYYIKARKESSKNINKEIKIYGKYIIFNLVNTFIVKVILAIHYFNENTALNLFVYRFSHIITVIIITNLRIESKHHIDEYQKVDGNNDNENTLFPIGDGIIEEEKDVKGDADN